MAHSLKHKKLNVKSLGKDLSVTQNSHSGYGVRKGHNYLKARYVITLPSVTDPSQKAGCKSKIILLNSGASNKTTKTAVRDSTVSKKGSRCDHAP